LADILANSKNLYNGSLSTTPVSLTPSAGKRWVVLEIRLCAEAAVAVNLSLVVGTNTYPIYKNLSLAAGDTLVDPAYFVVPDSASLQASASGTGATLHLNGCEV